MMRYTPNTLNGVATFMALLTIAVGLRPSSSQGVLLLMIAVSLFAQLMAVVMADYTSYLVPHTATFAMAAAATTAASVWLTLWAVGVLSGWIVWPVLLLAFGLWVAGMVLRDKVTLQWALSMLAHFGLLGVELVGTFALIVALTGSKTSAGFCSLLLGSGVTIMVVRRWYVARDWVRRPLTTTVVGSSPSSPSAKVHP